MQISKFIGGILLVSGTTIGGGVLALPTATINGGFWPSVLIFLMCWVFMTTASFYLLEVNLSFKKSTNLISMADKSLGIFGKWFAWVTYLTLLYSLICLYLTGGGAWIIKLFPPEINITSNIAIISLSLIVGLVIFTGTKAADLLNRVLSVTLVCSYLLLIFICLPEVDNNLIASENFINIIPTLPLIVTTFGFAIVIPSLTEYFSKDKNQLIQIIIIGSMIPLAVYILWEYVTLGSLSVPGEYGLKELAARDANGTEVASALEHIIGNKNINLTAVLFSVTAIITSFIGVSLSLFHFLADGFNKSRKGKSGGIIFVLTFLPPIIIVMFFPAGFNKILSFGGIFVAGLLGILPVAMTYTLRYKYKLITQKNYIVPGGKGMLLLTLLFFVYTIIVELISYF